MKILKRLGQIRNLLTYYIYNNWVTHVPIHWARLMYMRRLLRMHVGKGAFVHMGCVFYENVEIGRGSVIGRGCHLLGNITIKANVSITAQTYMFSSSHDKDDPDFRAYTKPILIEDHAWIGARAMVQPGVRVGVGAVLAANSTATRDIPDYMVYGGTPAKKIGERARNLRYQLNYSPFLQ